MLAATRAFRPRPATAFVSRIPRRTLFKSAWTALGNQYVDLAIALPFPPGFPAYTTTIVIVAVAIRVFTAPFQYWVRYLKMRLSSRTDAAQMLKRRWRSEEVVKPRLISMIPAIRAKAHQDLARIRPRPSVEEMQAIYNKDFPIQVRLVPFELTLY